MKQLSKLQLLFREEQRRAAHARRAAAKREFRERQERKIKEAVEVLHALGATRFIKPNVFC